MSAKPGVAFRPVNRSANAGLCDPGMRGRRWFTTAAAASIPFPSPVRTQPKLRGASFTALERSAPPNTIIGG